MMKSFVSIAAALLLAATATAQPLQTGADRLNEYLPLLQGKRVGVTANHTAQTGGKHLVDVLLENHIQAVRIYAPEHGFRGTAGAGEKVNTAKDEQTGLEIASLYGKHYKPTKEQLRDIDCMVFDLQDVGVRFYTYLSTLHYVMEACAENNIPLIVLDRPNPNGFYVDGPVLEPKYRSFVGMHPIPIVHGMTLGELAQMINGEGWLKNKVRCTLTVIPCAHYTHRMEYILPVYPSPNLTGQLAVYLYPSLCLFEGTPISVGRGTERPFQQFGHPALEPFYPYSFMPQPTPAAPHPPHQGQWCYGQNLMYHPETGLIGDRHLILDWLIEAYNHFPKKDQFFTPFFYQLSGTETLRRQIEQGMTPTDIRATWQPALEQFRQLRSRYLIYED